MEIEKKRLYVRNIFNWLRIGSSDALLDTEKLQKKIRIMKVVNPRKSRTCTFKRSGILPLPCEYMFSLMNFIVNNQDNFQTNSAVHNVRTRNKHYLRRPIAKSYFQEVHAVLASKFSTICHLVSKVLGIKRKM
jgi:hypothetical protein